jgi:thioredoxin 1
MEYKFTADNFEEEVLKSTQPVLIDFYASWCMPCQMMSPVISDLAKKYEGRIKIGKVDSDAEQELSMKYGITSIPNFVFIKNGELVDRQVGAVPAEILEKKIANLL